MEKIKWTKYSEDLKGNQTFVFFIQRLNELLFDYTLDSYKPRVLNTPLLCKELLNVIGEVENDVIDKKNVEKVYEELKWSFKSDPVAKLLVQGRRDDYFERVDINDLKKLKLVMKLLKNKLNDFDYIELSKIRIKRLINEKSMEKKDLDKVLSSLITSLIHLGYNKGFIFRKFKQIFVRPKDNVNTLEVVDDFFGNFNNIKNHYSVVFKGRELFNKFKDSCEPFGIQILDDLDTVVDKNLLEVSSKKFIESKNSKEVFIVAPMVGELDSESARVYANKRVETIANLFIFFHHKQSPVWNNRGLVIRWNEEEVEKSAIIGESTPVLHKTMDLTPVKASHELKKVLKKFTIERNSLTRFVTAIDLHASAIRSSDIESQLLNLWISLETLIEPNKSKSKIENYIDVLSSYLVYNYIEKLFRYVSKSLLGNVSRLIREKAEKVEGKLKFHEKVAAIIVSDEFETERKELLNGLERFPLLKYRIIQLNEEFSKGKKIRQFIEGHQFKIKLQLQRIYRIRNLIVHSGRNTGFTENLTENLHNYVDSFLKIVIDLSLDNKRINSIDQASLEVELLVSRHLRLLEEKKDEGVKIENIEALLFGKSV